MDRLRLLIVDDEPALRRGTERALRNFTLALPEVGGEVGLAIEQAGSAEEALQLIDRARPDIMLLDLRLPGMTGLELLEEIGGKGILTVLVTAYASLDMAVKATKRGAHDVLPKPFRPDELTATVSKAAHHLIMNRQARQLADEKRRVRFEFISLVAHELKAPLTAVSGYLQILADRDSAVSSGAYDQIVERSQVRIEAMRKMINDLLDLTRIESGERRRALGEIDVYDIARSCLELCRVDGIEQGLTVTLEPDHGPVPMNGDRWEVETILTNLLSNAVKYNRPGGRVDVRLERSESAITIRVRDTGIGMTPQESSTIFADFSRVKSDATRHIAGSGLGLAIVKRVVDLYDGRIAVEGEPGVGTTFTVMLRSGPTSPSACTPSLPESAMAGTPQG